MLNKSPQQYASPGRFWLKHIVPALIFILLMLLVYPHTHLDTRITDLFFDAQPAMHAPQQTTDVFY